MELLNMCDEIFLDAFFELLLGEDDNFNEIDQKWSKQQTCYCHFFTGNYVSYCKFQCNKIMSLWKKHNSLYMLMAFCPELHAWQSYV